MSESERVLRVAKRERSARDQSDEALSARVREVHQRSRGAYGALCIHAELAAQGTPVSRKRVAGVMREAGLAGVSRRKGPRTARCDPKARPAPDFVERRFDADGPDRLWVAGGCCGIHIRPLSSFSALAAGTQSCGQRERGFRNGLVEGAGPRQPRQPPTLCSPHPWKPRAGGRAAYRGRLPDRATRLLAVVSHVVS